MMKYKSDISMDTSVVADSFIIMSRSFLDTFLNFDPSTIYAPCPIVIEYPYNGEILQHSPDYYIDIIDLIIEIKHGGSNPNKHPKIQAVDVAKDKAKEEAIKAQTNHNYIKIVDNDFKPLVQLLARLTDQRISNTKERLIMINESATTEVSMEISDLYFIIYGDSLNGDYDVAVSFTNTGDRIVIYDGVFRLLEGESARKITTPNGGSHIVTWFKYIDKTSMATSNLALLEKVSCAKSVPMTNTFNAFATMYPIIFTKKSNYGILDFITSIYLTKVDIG